MSHKSAELPKPFLQIVDELVQSYNQTHPPHAIYGRVNISLDVIQIRILREAADLYHLQFYQPSQEVEGLPSELLIAEKCQYRFQYGSRNREIWLEAATWMKQFASDIIAKKDEMIETVKNSNIQFSKMNSDLSEIILKQDGEIARERAEKEELRKEVEQLKGITAICPSCEYDESKMPCQLCDNMGRYPIDSIISELSTLRKENEQLRQLLSNCVDTFEVVVDGHREIEQGELMDAIRKELKINH